MATHIPTRAEQRQEAVFRETEDKKEILVEITIDGKAKHMQRHSEEPSSSFLRRAKLLTNPWITPAKYPKKSSLRKKKKKDREASSSTDPPAPLPAHTLRRYAFLDQSGEELPENLSLRQALERAQTLVLGEVLYDLQVNPPTALELSLPQVAIEGCELLPFYRTQYTDRCLWTWRRKEKDQEQGVIVGEYEAYEPSALDVGKILEVTCQPLLRISPTEKRKGRPRSAETTEVISLPDQAPYKERSMATKQPVWCLSSDPPIVTLKGNEKASSPVSLVEESEVVSSLSLVESTDFRLMTYNILFHDFATPEQYPYCNPKNLVQERRMQLVLREILLSNSDVICMQEMGEHVFENYFLRYLDRHGYDGFYSGKHGLSREGLATFVRTKCWDVLRRVDLPLGSAFPEVLPDLFAQLEAYPATRETLSGLPNAAQLMIMQHKVDTSKLILLVNTHLYYHQHGHPLRILQMALILEKVRQLIEEVSSELPRPSVIICGDFNSLPESALVSFLRDGRLGTDHPDWAHGRLFKRTKQDFISNNGSLDGEGIRLDIPLSHKFKLQLQEPLLPFTNYVRGFQEVLDYVFIEETLEFLRPIPGVDPSYFSQEVALPSSIFPSDHIPLIYDIHFKEDK